ncbi:MAG: hypothetical protein DI539_12300 [Flavobacterium psychrophilum]|nr:MAG: hypothetical protein DI539_12300 [Flavobacterium psychrophilum]
MNKKRLGIGVVVLLVLVSGLLYGYYGFLYKPVRNIETEESAFVMPAQGLAGEYASNSGKADGKYLNQTIEVKGKITEVRDSLLIIDNKIVCGFDTMPANTGVNKDITIKGRCIGFDELFGEVKLDQCTIKQ